MIELNEDVIQTLREQVRPYLKEKRYKHTLEVEEEAARIGAVYLPEKIDKLRVSALLHDITKRDSFEKQLQYCEEFGIILNHNDLSFPRPLHAVTAEAVARRDFADFTDDEILSGIRFHTTGRDGMSVFESIVYLADYIEPSRTFDDCIAVRNYFWGSMPDGEDRKAQVIHLLRTMVLSFDLTIQSLLDDGEPVAPDTVLARNCFLGRMHALTED